MTVLDNLTATPDPSLSSLVPSGGNPSAANDDSLNDSSVPSYMVAANLHNYGNQNTAWDIPPEDQGNLLTRAGKFTAVSLASGVNSFYNTAIWAGNWFSDKDAQYRDTQQFISDTFDDDLGNYYAKNKQSADLMGFALTSFVPGLGGVKVLSAGAKVLGIAREGTIGFNMSQALGLATGSRDALVAAAVKDIADTGTAYSLLNPNALKAIASGFGQQALQAAAFETAVAVTMKKSPILNDLDFGETLANITTGALLGGAIGGTIEGAISARAIKKGLIARNAEDIGLTRIAEGADGTSPSDAIIIHANDLATTAVPGEDALAQQQLFNTKKRAIAVKTRDAWGTLAGGDEDLASVVYDTTKNMSVDDISNNVLGLQKIERLSAPLEDAVDDAGNAVTSNTKAMYLQVAGENTGQLSHDAPAIPALADTLPKGGSIGISGKGVTVGDRFFESSVGDGTDFANITDPQVAEARYIQALSGDSFETIASRYKDGRPVTIDHHDIAFLEKAYNEGFSNWEMRLPDGGVVDGLPPKQLLGYLQDIKERIAQTHLNNVAEEVAAENAAKMEKFNNRQEGVVEGDSPLNFGKETAPTLSADEASTEMIARIVNTKLAYLEGTSQNTDDVTRDLFAMQDMRRQAVELANNTGKNISESEASPWLQPQNVRLLYDTTPVKDINNNILTGMLAIQEKQRILQVDQDAAAASVLGDTYARLPDNFRASVLKANVIGAGAKFASFAAGGYSDLAGKVEGIGGIVTKAIQEAQDNTANRFLAQNYALAQNPAAVAEVAAIDSLVRSSGMKYVKNIVTDADGNETTQGLILKVVRDYNAAVANGSKAVRPLIPAGIKETVDFSSPEARMWIENHITINGERVVGKNNLDGARSIATNIAPDEYYPIPPSPSKYPFHAFVVDPSITGTGHVSMIYAQDAEGLARLISKVPDDFEVLTKDDVANYKKATGQYVYSEGINQNYINTALARKGTSANFFPVTDPASFIEDAMAWHTRQDSNLIRDAISTKYSTEFNELRDMGDRFAKLQTSTANLFGQSATSSVTNPYESYVKAALGVSNIADYPIWNAINRGVDQAGSAVWNAVKSIWDGATSSGPSIEQLGMINNILDRYGVQTAYQDAATNLFVNSAKSTTAVSDFIRNANGIMSSMTLRLDPMNALNNVLGATVLRGAETASVLRLIESRSDLVGELKDLYHVTVPGVENTVFSPTKLIATGIKNFFADDPATAARYEALGISQTQRQQFRNMVDTLAITGSETPAELQGLIGKALQMGKNLTDGAEKWSGNKLAESLNRFISANIMDQLTGLAVKKGLMDEATANGFIQTFVNRVEGNTLAAQRPMMFQGPIGQAIGLFQTYQFNIMQQLLRYVGEGTAKDAATLLGLQGTIYGLNGLPAFGAINSHIIGTASGNTSHTDAYTSINNIAGKTAGDWLTYGVASNFLLHPDLKLNLYTRGDINPRSLTVVPTQLSDVPIVSGFAKFFGNLKETVGKIQNGGDVWNSILQGIEHNGINRPLAGLAQVLEASGNSNGQSFSTSTKGNIVASNDFNSLANFARLSGARPLDEAVGLDAMFRVNAYKAKDNADRQQLGEAMKTTMISGNNPTLDQVTQFAKEYAATGGKQEEFNKFFMQQYKNANTSQANTLMSHLNNPYSQYMQQIMGGRQFRVTPSQAPVVNDPNQ